MFIRFEIAGRGMYIANHLPLGPSRGGKRRRRRPLEGRAKDEYDRLGSRFLVGVSSPDSSHYKAPPGFEARTYFRVGLCTSEQIAAAWAMVSLLRRHGWRAYEVFRHTPPGRVVYRDEHQIVVWSRKRRRRRRGWNGDRTTIRRWPCRER